METKRFPLSATLAPRSKLTTKDGLLRNVYHETTPIGDMIIKRPGLLTQFNTGLGCAQGSITYNGQVFVIMGESYGLIPAPPAKAQGPWTPYSLQHHPGNGVNSGLSRTGILGSLKGNLYNIALPDPAIVYTPAVYVSTDNGANWTTAAAPQWAFPSELIGRQLSVTRDDTLFIVLAAGSTAGGNAQVWSTTDAVNWALLSEDMGSGTESPQAVLLHSDGRIYAFFEDSITASTTGMVWVPVAAASGWGIRHNYAVWTLNDDMFLGAGEMAGAAISDVWQSTDDGVTWGKIAVAAFPSRISAGYWSFDSKLWIGGGDEDASPIPPERQDLWSSVDGAVWALENSSFVGTGLSQMTFTNHNNTMYVGNGVDSARNTKEISAYAPGEPVTVVTPLVLTPIFPPPLVPCEPFTMALIPASGATPTKIFFKDSNDAWVFDGTVVVQVLDPDYPAKTVPGVVYLDGTIYVMNSQGIIFGSDINNPLSWSALNFISANSEADPAVVLARQLNYVVAFKASSTEFFYDAANATGSPLGKVLNALLEIGCAHAQSLAFADNTIYFMANSRQKGRSIMKLEGYTPKVISNPYIDRILNGDDLSTVYAYVVKSNGHFFYLLTLVDSKITLVYDEASAEWHTWTTLTADALVDSASAMVQSDGSILITMLVAHGQEDGNLVIIAGSTTSAVNGTFNLRYDPLTMTIRQFSYYPTAAVSGSIGGSITAGFFTESYFPAAFYGFGSGVDYLIDQSNGLIYIFDPETYGDNLIPINVLSRSAILDFGVIAEKRYSRLELVGDQEPTTVLVRYSDDDYQTDSLYRPIALDLRRPMLSNLGSARRRSYTFRNIDQTALRLMAAEVDIDINAF